MRKENKNENDHSHLSINHTNSSPSDRENSESCEESSQSDSSKSLSKITETDEQINVNFETVNIEEMPNNFISLGRKSNNPVINFDTNRLKRRSIKLNRISELVFPADRSDSISPDHSNLNKLISLYQC